MKRSVVPGASGVVATLALVFMDGAALAQPVTDDVLEEVVISGQRRSESLQTVPVAVSALGSEQLLQSGVQTFSDLQALTPSLAISDGPGGRYLNIRGVGIGVGTPFQSAGVPLHLDGMYVTRSEFFIREAYFDLERAEVYRGPQGTFAGQNSTGGAIFLAANQPSLDGFSGQPAADHRQLRVVPDAGRREPADLQPVGRASRVQLGASRQLHHRISDAAAPVSGTFPRCRIPTIPAI